MIANSLAYLEQRATRVAGEDVVRQAYHDYRYARLSAHSDRERRAADARYRYVIIWLAEGVPYEYA